MRKLIIGIVLFGSTLTVSGQTWSAVSGGIKSPTANTTWAFSSYDSVLYVGGWFDTCGSVATNNISQWNGSLWSPLGSGIKGTVNAIMEYKGNVYVGGEFDSVGGIAIHDIAMWNGSAWAPVGKGIKDDEYGVYCMAIYNNELYVGGSFDSVDGKKVFGIAKWDGAAWSAVGTGIYAADEDDGVFTLAVYNGELYAGGGFDSAGGVPLKEIARWNGTRWADVGNSVNDGGTIFSLAVYNGNLYVGGMFDTAGGTLVVNRIAMWNGSNWAALDSGITGEAGWASVSALQAYNGLLYVGGYFDTVNGKPINCIAGWNGTTWSPVGGINVGGSVDVMTVFNNSLYVGGGFDSAGGVYALNIVMLTTPNTVARIINDISVNVYPNPAQDELTIRIDGNMRVMQYEIYDEMGQKIVNGNLHSELSIINVSAFATGVYILKIVDGGNLLSSVFVKS